MLPIFRTIDGRQAISLWASRIFEKSAVKRLVGVNLVAAVIVTGVLTPEADNLLSQHAVTVNVSETPITADPITETTIETPFADFKLSQKFSFWHPGIDMTAPSGTPVSAIDWGFVASIEHSTWGYGKNIVVSHAHRLSSLYAHLSEINVAVGQKIGRGEIIGKVGSTGWSSGNHLHLEIHQEGKPINPLELLPLNLEEIKYASASSVASSSATPTLLPL